MPSLWLVRTEVKVFEETRVLTDAAVEKAIARLIKQLERSPTMDENAWVLITQAYYALSGASPVRRD